MAQRHENPNNAPLFAWMAVLGIATILLIGGSWYFAAPPAGPVAPHAPAVADSTFDAWWAEHAKTCQQCAAARRAPTTGMCEVAFDRLKADLRKANIQKPAPVQQPADVLPASVALFGYVPDPPATRAFVASLPRPTLAQAGPDVLKAASDRPAFLYRALDRVHRQRFGKPWAPHRQGIGDCVSHGWGHACDVHLAIMVLLGDVSAKDFQLAATESIYGGSRVEARGRSAGGWGDGSYGGAAAKWVRDWGVTSRRDYRPEFPFDLTTYDSRLAKQWGNYGNGGAGDGGKFDQEAKKHPVHEVTVVRTFKEAAAAIQSGYPVAVCSGQGFSSRRDEKGFARASGSWAHCMAFVAVRFDRPGLLCQNSWGSTWISGPKWPDDQPDGSFWVDAAVCDRMLSGGDSFAVSGYDGFPLKTLKHGDWASVSTSPDQSLALAP